jgi:histidine triad (HIT) family protein
VTAGVVAKKLGLARGFRLVINHGPDACESVPHLHVHLLAKRQLSWPPG